MWLFGGLQFDFAKCSDSIPYSVIWSTLKHYGCDPAFVTLLAHLYENISRCFRYAGWNGSLLGLPQLACCKVILWVWSSLTLFRPLINRLSSIADPSVYALADDLTVVSSSWDTLSSAYAVFGFLVLLLTFVSTFPNANCGKLLQAWPIQLKGGSGTTEARQCLLKLLPLGWPAVEASLSNPSYLQLGCCSGQPGEHLA